MTKRWKRITRIRSRMVCLLVTLGKDRAREKTLLFMPTFGRMPLVDRRRLRRRTMPIVEEAKKTVKLRRSGGSQSIVLPKSWLQQIGAVDEVEIAQTNAGILIRAARQTSPSIENEPEFAQFLSFLAKDALAHPDTLGDVGQLMEDDQELFRDVRVD